jgi:erythromycin esterase-like protein
MVEWMRRFDREQKAVGSTKNVAYTGFDMQFCSKSIEIVETFLAEHDPELAQRIGRIYAPLEKARISEGNPFGCATDMLDVDKARGKKLVLSGWIKTEELENGWAGLWLRVDGPTKRFDNMQNRGPRGTSDWTNVRIEVEVPEDAQAIYYGLLMPGKGRAWFDDLALELDGKPWPDLSTDLQFERDTLGRFSLSNPQRNGVPSGPYSITLDSSVQHGGKQSARIERVPDPRDVITPKDAEAAARAALGQLERERATLIKGSDARTVDWIIQNARIIHQWSGLDAGPESSYAHRDRCMAANVAWILEQDPKAKLVLWAHNCHVSTADTWMGTHLREKLGAHYVNLAFCSSSGTYTARSGGDEPNPGELREFPLQTPPAESIEALLEATGIPQLILDLRPSRENDPASGWLREPRPFGGWIGALSEKNHYTSATLAKEYDLVLYLRQTSAARQLATPPKRVER